MPNSNGSHGETLPTPAQILTHLIETVAQLRAPGGCPWDRAQTPQSLRPHLIEEAYEALDVLDEVHTLDDLNLPSIKHALREELGDVLMQVLLHSEIAREVGAFDFYEVAKELDEKLIRRHPHVFGNAQAKNSDQALKNWEQSKAKEKPASKGVLDGLPRNLSALHRATRMIEKVTRVGFQWEDMQGPLAKVDEELSELKTEILAFKQTQDAELRKKIESEMGDLLFTLCNLSFLMKINPEDALRSTLERFMKRFQHVERSVKATGKTLNDSDLKEMDSFWKEAKSLEKVRIWGLTGGIGAGKSEAAKVFQNLGFPVVNADHIGKEILEKNSSVRTQVETRFGTTDRMQLRNLVFNDVSARKDLEEILHPLVYVESLRQIRELAPKHPVVVYEAAILIESGRHRDLTGVITIEAPQVLRMERICKRDGISIPLAEKMIAAQLSDAERKRYASHVIQNDGNLESLKQQISTLVL